MTNTTTQTQTNALIQAVYEAVPAALQQYVREAWLYHGASLEDGTETMEEFVAHVQDFAASAEADRAHKERCEELMAGVSQLVTDGKIAHEGFAEELREQLEAGDSSLLARFITLQPVISPLDAALSFLAWQHPHAISELEGAFGVDLSAISGDQLLDHDEHSESMMTLFNLSVLSS